MVYNPFQIGKLYRRTVGHLTKQELELANETGLALIGKSYNPFPICILKSKPGFGWNGQDIVGYTKLKVLTADGLTGWFMARNDRYKLCSISDESESNNG